MSFGTNNLRNVNVTLQFSKKLLKYKTWKSLKCFTGKFKTIIKNLQIFIYMTEKVVFICTHTTLNAEYDGHFNPNSKRRH